MKVYGEAERTGCCCLGFKKYTESRLFVEKAKSENAESTYEA